MSNGVNSKIVTAVGFLKLVEDYSRYTANVIGGPSFQPCISPAKWDAPLQGWIKVNVDAHVLIGVKTSLGVVMRDDNGTLKVMGVKHISPTSVEQEEAEAAKYGVALAQRLGFMKVMLEFDTAGVASAIKTGANDAAPVYLIYDDIKRGISL